MRTTTKDPRGKGSRTPRETYLAPKDKAQLEKVIDTLKELYGMVPAPNGDRTAKRHVLHAWEMIDAFLVD